HVGGHRAAAGLKLVHNAMLGACTLATAELTAVALRAGLDGETAFRLLARTMPSIRSSRASCLDRVQEPPLFEVVAMVKDLDLALELGRRAGAAMPSVAQARELFAAAVPEHGHREVTAVIERYLA